MLFLQDLYEYIEYIIMYRWMQIESIDYIKCEI